MQVDRTAMIGAAAFLAGAVLTYAVGSSSRAGLEAQLRQQADLGARVAALGETVEARLGEIEARIGGVEGSVAALSETRSADLAGLAERIDGLGSELSGALGGLGADVSGALAADLEGLRTRLGEIASRGVATLGGAALGAGAAAGAGTGAAAGAAAGAVAAEAEASGGPAAEPGAGEALEIGRAASAAEGRLRLFLAAADPEAGSARVAVNGVETVPLALGEATPVGDCTLTLTGFAERGATVAAECGGAGEASAEGAAAPAAAALGEGTTVAVGAAGAVAEGVRAFVSAVDPEAGVARVAFNGVGVTTLSLGEPVAVGDCAAELTGAEPGQATIAFGC